MAVVVARTGAVARPGRADASTASRGSPTSRSPATSTCVDELPLTENGKVRKFVLRERGVTETTWDREASGYVLRR